MPSVIVSGSNDGGAKLWDLQNGECLQTLMGPKSFVTSVQVSKDGRRVVVGYRTGLVNVYDPITGTLCNSLLDARGEGIFVPAPLYRVAITPDGTQVLFGSRTHGVKLWNLSVTDATGSRESCDDHHHSNVYCVAISSDNHLAVSGSCDKTIKVWDLTSTLNLHCVRTLSGHASAVFDVAFAPTTANKTIVSSSSDNSIKIWDLPSGKCLRTLIGHSHQIHSVVVSPDSKRIVSGSYDCTVRVWDFASGKCLQSLEGHSNAVLSVTVSADALTIVSGSEDKSIKLWDIKSGACVKTLHGHLDQVNSVVISSALDATTMRQAINSIKATSTKMQQVSPLDKAPRTKAVVANSVKESTKPPEQRQALSERIQCENLQVTLKQAMGRLRYKNVVAALQTASLLVDQMAKLQDSEPLTCSLKSLHQVDDQLRVNAKHIHQLEIATKVLVRKIVLASHSKCKPNQSCSSTHGAQAVDLSKLTGERDASRQELIKALQIRERLLLQCHELLTKIARLQANVSDANTLETLQRLNETQPLASVLKDQEELDRKISQNAALIRELDSKCLALVQAMKQQSTSHDVTRVKSLASVRQSMATAQREREFLLAEWAKVLTKRHKLEAIVNSCSSPGTPNAPSTKALQETAKQEQVRCESEAFDANVPDQLRVKYSSLVNNLLDEFLPRASRFDQLESEFGQWQTREITWYNLFLYASQVQDMASKAQEHAQLRTTLDKDCATLMSHMKAMTGMISSYFAAVRELLASSTFTNSRLRAQQDLQLVRNELQLLGEASTVAFRVQQATIAKDKVASEIRGKLQEIDLLQHDMKWCKDPKQLEQHRIKKKQLQDALVPLYEHIRGHHTAMTHQTHLLGDHFPELLVTPPQHTQNRWIGGDWRACRCTWDSIVNELVHFGDFRLVESIVPDRVMVMMDPNGQKCVVSKLFLATHQLQLLRQDTLHATERIRAWRLDHPLIVPVINVFVDSVETDTSVCFVQTPWYPRGNLRPWVRRIQTQVARTETFRECFEWVEEIHNTFRQITQALLFAHGQGVVHGNLKPENVLVKEGGTIAVGDFQIEGITTSTSSGSIGPHSDYTAPEVATNEWKKMPSAVDMWALGCMMLELVLPVLPRVFPDLFGHFSKSQSVRIGAVVGSLEATNWTTLEHVFESQAHLKAYVRACARLLQNRPESRLSAQELLLHEAFQWNPCPLDPLASPKQSLQEVLSKIRLMQDGKESDTLVVRVPEATESLCGHLLNEWADLDGQVLSQCSLVFQSEQDNRVFVLAEITRELFLQVVQPQFGLFTRRIDDDPEQMASDQEETILHDWYSDGHGAWLPSRKGDQKYLRVVGMLLAKCLLEGICVPLRLNTCCLRYIRGDRQVPENVDKCLALLAESNEFDGILYRNVLRERRTKTAHCLEDNVLKKGVHQELQVTDANKAQVITETIWKLLVEDRQPSLESLAQGFYSVLSLDTLQQAKLLDNSLQVLLAVGNEYLDVDRMLEGIHFTEKAWMDLEQMRQTRKWFQQWLAKTSDLTRRMLLFQLFGQWSFMEPYAPPPSIFVVPSADAKVHFDACEGILRLPPNWSSEEALELSLQQELRLSSLKSPASKVGPSNPSIAAPISFSNELMASGHKEVRTSGWYRCMHGHVFHRAEAEACSICTDASNDTESTSCVQETHSAA